MGTQRSEIYPRVRVSQETEALIRSSVKTVSHGSVEYGVRNATRWMQMAGAVRRQVNLGQSGAKAMNTAERVLEEIADLPESLQQEVLDFAHFLKQRADREQQRNLRNAQISSLERLWDNPDDEVWNDVPVR